MFGIKQGFTLIELVVAVAIFGLLATIVIPQLGRRNPVKEREQFVGALNALMRKVAIDAVISNKVHRVLIDVANRRITALQQTTQKDDQGQWIYMPSKRSYAHIPLMIPAAYAIKNIIVEGFDEMARTSGGATTTVWFYIMPHGFSQQVTINIMDRSDANRGAQGQPMGLVLNPLTIQFRMYNALQ